MIFWLLIHIVLFFVFPIGLVMSIPLHILMGNDSTEKRKQKNEILKQEIAEMQEKLKQQKEEKLRAKENEIK